MSILRHFCLLWATVNKLAPTLGNLDQYLYKRPLICGSSVFMFTTSTREGDDLVKTGSTSSCLAGGQDNLRPS